MLAGFIPEQWPASNWNPWPTSVGIITLEIGDKNENWTIYVP
jgi:hypothetical protein